VVAEDQLSAEDRPERGAWVGCIAGALSRSEYKAGLAAAGFEQVSVAFTHQVGDGLHSAIIKATKPTDTDRALRSDRSPDAGTAVADEHGQPDGELS
jgi:arsenite methyltransferase